MGKPVALLLLVAVTEDAMCHDAVDTGAEANYRLVGRGFSRDIKPAFPSGVSTPERFPKSFFRNFFRMISGCGLIRRRRREMPEVGIRKRERHAGFDCPAAPRAEKDDAAVLLFLRQHVGEQ